MSQALRRIKFNVLKPTMVDLESQVNLDADIRTGIVFHGLPAASILDLREVSEKQWEDYLRPFDNDNSRRKIDNYDASSSTLNLASLTDEQIKALTSIRDSIRLSLCQDSRVSDIGRSGLMAHVDATTADWQVRQAISHAVKDAVKERNDDQRFWDVQYTTAIYDHRPKDTAHMTQNYETQQTHGELAGLMNLVVKKLDFSTCFTQYPDLLHDEGHPRAVETWSQATGLWAHCVRQEIFAETRKNIRLESRESALELLKSYEGITSAVKASFMVLSRRADHLGLGVKAADKDSYLEDMRTDYMRKAQENNELGWLPSYARIQKAKTSSRGNEKGGDSEPVST